MTTSEPVMNPDLVADVYFNPIVCVKNPRKRKTPKNIPGRIEFLSSFLFEKIIISARTTAAIPNRNAMKSEEEISFKDSLTITNVPPHRIVITSRTLSPVNLPIGFCGELFFIFTVTETS
jgi:hypothetical protein